MEILSLCPFRAAALLWQAAPAAWSLTTVVKATYQLVNFGEATIAPVQDPIGAAPEDLAPLKARADVIVVGHAHAPGGAPIGELITRVDVGGFGKSLRIRGDQRWTPGPGGLERGAVESFVSMPLVYERAARTSELPAGVDLDAPPLLGGLAAPNIEADPGHMPGYGPVPIVWPCRRREASGPALVWAAAALRGGVIPIGPPPEGFDFSLFNAAPREQQVDLVRASAPIVLQHLHPEHAWLETRLPSQKPQAFRVDPRSGRVSEVVLRCDTVWIDVDRGVVVLTFRGLTDLAVADEHASGKLVIAVHSQGKRIRPERIDRFLRQGGSLEEDGGEAKHPLEVRHDAVLVAPGKSDTVALPELSPSTTIAIPESTLGAPGRLAAPFAPNPEGGPPPVARRARAGTIPLPTDPNDSGLLDALPFRPAEPAPPAAFPPPPALVERPPVEAKQQTEPPPPPSPLVEPVDEESTNRMVPEDLPTDTEPLPPSKVITEPEPPVSEPPKPPASAPKPPAPKPPAPSGPVSGKPALRVPAPLGPRLGKGAPQAPPRPAVAPSKAAGPPSVKPKSEEPT